MSAGGFVAEGWNALHRAILDRGVKVGYYPQDYPERRGRSFVDAALYQAHAGRVLNLAGIKVDVYGCRSTLVQRAVWRWVRTTAKREFSDQWSLVCGMKSWIALLAAYQDAVRGERVRRGPKYSTSDLHSVVRFGYWLFLKGSIPGSPPIAAIVWGLAILGSAWGLHLQCGRCKLCFRRSKPGEVHCDFHSQSGLNERNRSEAYTRYRRGRRAQQLALQNSDLNKFLYGTPIDLSVGEHLVLPDVLFPLIPADGDWTSERDSLVEVLHVSPRVVGAAGISRFWTMHYEALVERLRQTIDPNDWNSDLWDFKVLQAEKWLELEENVSPGIRRQGHRTTKMVERAIALATSGTSNRDIAAALGVTPSAVSQWKRRYPIFRAATAHRAGN